VTGWRAAVTLGLTGRYAVQARQALAGLELWAEDDDIELHVDDDAGSPLVALAAYRAFMAGDFDILLGPYSSGLVRRVAATVCGARRLLWNHGGAADDLARRGLVSVVAPASTYLRALLMVCRRRGVESVQLVRGSGPFAHHVIEGARGQAVLMGLPVDVAPTRPELCRPDHHQPVVDRQLNDRTPRTGRLSPRLGIDRLMPTSA